MLFRTLLAALCAISAWSGAYAASESAVEALEANLRFVIVGDRTGGHRPGVFSAGLAKAELLKPDLVISVGDLIEGYTEDEAEIRRQWEEVSGPISTLSMPFHAVPGNHDYSNQTMAKIWRERRGAAWWAFTRGNVLFIGLSTEDPPVLQNAKTLASTRQLEEAMARDPETTQAKLLDAVRARGAPPELPGTAAISDRQVDFVRQALDKHSGVAWTFVIMHKPAWKYASDEFAEIEALLSGRDYTVIAGHEHYYSHETRLGRDYIVMGTTGGVWLKDGPGRVDHITLVTVTASGPVLANIRTGGVFGKEGQPTSMPEGEAVSSGQ